MEERANPDPAGPEVHATALLLPWYLSGTLGDGDRESVTRHLAGCASCCAELEALTQVRRTLRATLAASSPSRRAARRWRLAAALAVTLVVLQSVVVAVRWPAAPVAQIAGRGLGMAPARLELELDPAATELALRTLLRASSAHIVAGPSDDGRYVIELPTADPARVEATIAQLLAASGVVRHATRAP